MDYLILDSKTLFPIMNFTLGIIYRLQWSYSKKVSKLKRFIHHIYNSRWLNFMKYLLYRWRFICSNSIGCNMWIRIWLSFWDSIINQNLHILLKHLWTTAVFLCYFGGFSVTQSWVINDLLCLLLFGLLAWRCLFALNFRSLFCIFLLVVIDMIICINIQHY